MGHRDDNHYIGMSLINMVCDKIIFEFILKSFTALVDDNGKYLVNGNNVILKYAESYSYGGITLKYTGTDAVAEQVQTKYTRKLTRDLKVQVSQHAYIWFKNIYIYHRIFYAIFRIHTESTLNSVSKIMSRADDYPYDEMITCLYTRPLNTKPAQSRSFYAYNENTPPVVGPRAPPTPPTVIYQWQTGEWESCKAMCNGRRSRTSDCVQTDRHDNRVVAGAYCLTPRPKTTEPCNTHCHLR